MCWSLFFNAHPIRAIFIKKETPAQMVQCCQKVLGFGGAKFIKDSYTFHEMKIA